MKHLIGIIADDLTGANDSGVQLTEKGIHTSVLFDIPKQDSHLDEGIVIDTNSRALNKEEAELVTKQACTFLKEKAYQHIYKKVDSTLRGYIGLEIRVLQDIFDPEFVIIAPAYPAYGRTTENGIHYVNGKEIAKTEANHDPKHPVTDSSIVNILKKDINQGVGLLKRDDLDEVSFLEKMNGFKHNKVKYIVCDAEIQEDLKDVAGRIASFSDSVVWVGSAGLAEVLPEVLEINENRRVPDFSHARRVMTVCGSLSQVTHNQVKYAIRQQGVVAVELNTLEMFTESWETLKQGYNEKCFREFDKGNDIVLYVPSHEQIRKQVKQIGYEQGLSDNQIGERIAVSISQIVVDVARKRSELSGFVLTGGDTAKAVTLDIGGIGFRLIQQIEAGIPLGTLIDTERMFTVVTKAGAFGKEDSIYQAMQMLKGDLNNG